MNNDINSSDTIISKENNTSITLCAKQLNYSYIQGNNELQILNDMNLTVHAGQSIAIVGASGSGKSTLLHLLGALDEPISGEVFINNESITTASKSRQAQIRNESIGFIYQFHHLLAEFSALENVMMPLYIAKTDPMLAKQKASELLEKVKLKDRINHRPSELSGGERQRVAIARAIATNPKLILADEPTGNLDQKTANEIMSLLTELQQSINTALIVVTHDENLAYKMDKVYRLCDKNLIAVN